MLNPFMEREFVKSHSKNVASDPDNIVYPIFYIRKIVSKRVVQIYSEKASWFRVSRDNKKSVTVLN